MWDGRKEEEKIWEDTNQKSQTRFRTQAKRPCRQPEKVVKADLKEPVNR